VVRGADDTDQKRGHLVELGDPVHGDAIELDEPAFEVDGIRLSSDSGRWVVLGLSHRALSFSKRLQGAA
jgi:hypothetical protein